MLSDILSRFKVKLFNFKKKYHTEPKYLVLNPTHQIDEIQVYEWLAANMPYVTKFTIIYSFRVDMMDFEVY